MALKALVALSMLAVSAPSAAWACINAMAKAYRTYPLDYAVVGAGLSAIVLLLMRRKNRPSRAMQFATIGSGLLTGVGIGLWSATHSGFQVTGSVGWALFGVILLVVDIVCELGTGHPSEDDLDIAAFRLDRIPWGTIVALFVSVVASSSLFERPEPAPELLADVQPAVVF